MVFQQKSKNFKILIKKCQKRVFKHRDRNVIFAKISQFLVIFPGFFLAILLNIRKKLLLGGKLRLKGCLAMCLIFQENPGSRAYELVAYKEYKVY